MPRDSDEMKAILLAAGFGERLRPITETTPKCLVSIGEKPLLQHWLERLADSGRFDEVIVNTHYLAGEVVKFASNYRGPPCLYLSHEERLLGPVEHCFSIAQDLQKVTFWLLTRTIFRLSIGLHFFPHMRLARRGVSGL